MTLTDFLQLVVNGVQIGSIYALIALGYTMVYGVLRLINFAHGDVFMIGAYIGFYTFMFLKIPEQSSFNAGLPYLILAALVAMVLCALLGLIIERLAYRPLRKAPRLTALITAIGVSLFLVNGAQLVFGADFKNYPTVTPTETFTLGGVLFSKNQLTLVIAATILMGILFYVVQYTRIGKAMRAVSHDTDAAALMGVNTDLIIAFTFALGAGLAGAGGVLFIALTKTKVFPLLGVQMGLKAFVSAVVGGIGSIPGALLGGLLIGLMESFVKGLPKIGDVEPSRWVDAVAFVLLAVVLLLRPAGLLGKSGPEKV